jgi:uncharacterized membrane protein
MHRKTMTDTITQTIVVKGNTSDIFNVWANFENFPKFMKHIKSVTKTDEGRSHWVMQGPLGVKVDWDARITRLDPDRLIAWDSLDSDLKTSGQVSFNPLNDGETEISVILRYDPPAGLAGEVVAELFGNPEGRLLEDLRNFKEFIESTPSRIHTGRS